jgi:hypothetical protein
MAQYVLRTVHVRIGSRNCPDGSETPLPLCLDQRTSIDRLCWSVSRHDQTLGGYLTARTEGGIHDPSRIDGAFSFGQ